MLRSGSVELLLRWSLSLSSKHIEWSIVNRCCLLCPSEHASHRLLLMLLLLHSHEGIHHAWLGSLELLLHLLLLHHVLHHHLLLGVHHARCELLLIAIHAAHHHVVVHHHLRLRLSGHEAAQVRHEALWLGRVLGRVG